MLTNKQKVCIVLIFVVVIVVISTAFPGTKAFVIDTITKLKEMGTEGTLIFIILYAIAVIAILPITLINLSIGMIYPFWTA